MTCTVVFVYDDNCCILVMGSISLTTIMMDFDPDVIIIFHKNNNNGYDQYGIIYFYNNDE